jgi:hypothetical protein
LGALDFLIGTSNLPLGFKNKIFISFALEKYPKIIPKNNFLFHKFGDICNNEKKIMHKKNCSKNFTTSILRCLKKKFPLEKEFHVLPSALRKHNYIQLKKNMPTIVKK